MNRTGTFAVLALLVAAIVTLVFTLGRGDTPGPALTTRGGGTDAGVSAAAANGGAGGAAGAAEAVTERVLVGDAQTDPEGDPEIRRALTGFRGRVVGPDQVPVADCGVRIYRLALDSVLRPGAGVMGGAMDAPVIVGGEARTGEDGTFLIDGIWPRAIYIMAAGLDTDDTTHRIVQVTPPPGQIVDLGDVQLEARAVVTGTVVDEDGAPIAGAEVRGADLPGQLVGLFPVERFDPEGFILIRESGSPISVIEMPPWVKGVYEHLPIPRTMSDAEGRFRLTGLAAGSNLIATTKSGLLGDVRPNVRLKGGQERDLGRIRLEAGEELIGKVVDTEGKPVAGAEVVAGPTISIAPIDLASSVGLTNDKGEFRGEGFPEGRVTVAARRGPNDGWVLAEPQSIFDDIVVELPATHDLTVAVTVLGGDGELVDDPRLRLIPGKRGDGAFEMAFFGFVPEVNLKDRVEKLEDGRRRITGLAPGRYVVLATTTEHAVGSARVELQADTEVSVELPAKVLYAVRVVDVQGRGIRNAAIYAQGRGEGKIMDMPIHCGRTATDGTLTVDQVNAERIRVTADHPRYGSVHGESELGAAQVLLTMLEPGGIDGVLTQAGRPPALGEWTIVTIPYGRDARGAVEDTPGFSTPNRDGRFTVRGLQSGQYRVQVIKSLDALTSPGGVMTLAESMMMAGSLPEVEVNVTPGAVVAVTLDTEQNKQIEGPSARISGSVVVDGRIDTSLVMYSMGNGPRQVAKLDRAGRFDFEAVAEGDVQLALVDPEGLGGGFMSMRMGGGGALWSRSVKVVGGEDQELQIELQTSSIAGQVFTPDGDPARRGLVMARGQIGQGDDRDSVQFSAEVDSNGRFRFGRVPAGEYRLEVRSTDDRSGRGELRQVEVAGGLPVVGLEIVVQWTVQVSGSVDMSRWQEKPRWLYLTFESVDREGGRSSSGSGVEDDGSFEVDDLLPGRYRVRFHHQGQEDLRHPSEIVVGAEGLRDVVLRPVVKS